MIPIVISENIWKWYFESVILESVKIKSARVDAHYQWVQNSNPLPNLCTLMSSELLWFLPRHQDLLGRIFFLKVIIFAVHHFFFQKNFSSQVIQLSKIAELETKSSIMSSRPLEKQVVTKQCWVEPENTEPQTSITFR